MRYAQIRKMDISNGLGVGVSLFVQGCHFHCKGCFNSETWDFNGGEEYTEEKTLPTILELIEPDYITRFSLLGGEPLEDKNLWYITRLIMEIKKKRPDIKIWIYTGYTYEQLLKRRNDENNLPALRTEMDWILEDVDVLVEGQFQEDKKDLTYPFAGSTNQRVIDMNKTREQGKIVLLDI